MTREEENFTGEISRSRSYSFNFSIYKASFGTPFSKLFLLIWLSTLLILPRETTLDLAPCFEAERVNGLADAEF